LHRAGAEKVVLDGAGMAHCESSGKKIFVASNLDRQECQE
jgi:hypothetical protein